jgi:threonine dehydrogenase-like Zn-dependent dehydrogenase
MLAAVLHDVQNMTLEELPRPEPGEGEAVVAVQACGICQTDYCAFTGKRMNWPKETVLGHEFSGVIAEVGPGVKGWAPGDEVVVSPVGYCGVCRECRLGRQHYCHHGYVIGGDGQPRVYHGAFAEFVRVPAVALYAKPPALSFEGTALTEPLAGSFKGMIEYSQLRLGEDVVIVGAGRGSTCSASSRRATSRSRPGTFTSPRSAWMRPSR